MINIITYFEFVEFDADFPVKVFIIGMNDTKPHFHDALEIIYVLHGQVLIQTGETFTVNQGEFQLINCREMHCIYSGSKDNITMVIQIHPDAWRKINPKYQYIIFPHLSSKTPPALMNGLKNIISSVFLDLYQKKQNYKFSVYSQILRLVSLLTDNTECEIQDAEKLSQTDEARKRMYEVIDIIYQRYGEPLSVEWLAQAVHISSSRLAHWFKDTMGLSLGKFLLHVRISKAELLLAESDKTITEIALECGFTNVSAFGKAFRGFSGVSPSEYRRLQRQDGGCKNIDEVFYGINMQYSAVDRSKLNVLYEESVKLGSGFEKPAEAAARHEVLELDAQGPATPVKAIWKSLVCAGRAAEGLRADWREQFRAVQRELGFSHIRFHGLLHDEMLMASKKYGKLFLNWSYVDKLFDFLLENNCRPFVELGYMPSCLASKDTFAFWWRANTSPPADYSLWEELICGLASHLAGRYGLEEIRRWYFEVWNEPCYPEFWSGTMAEYFELYRRCANALRRVDEHLKLGGPASIQQKQDKILWMREFLEYCAANALPVDFVSFHPYPCDKAPDGRLFYHGPGNTLKQILALEALLAQSSYPAAEIVPSEWNSSSDMFDFVHDTAFMAPFIIQNYLECSCKVNTLGFWTFTDLMEESPPSDRLFYGGFGLKTANGLNKSGFYGFWFLNRLGDECISRGERHILTRGRNGALQLLMWNYCHYKQDFARGDRSMLSVFDRYGIFEASGPVRLYVKLALPENSYTVYHYHFGREKGSVYDRWLKMDAIESLDGRQLAILRKQQGPCAAFQRLNKVSGYESSYILSPHDVCLVEFIPSTAPQDIKDSII